MAFLAGLIIFPACFAFGVNPGEGPGLVFVTLPNIFNQMSAGRLWGVLFFVFMSFAALSTIIAVFENIISCCMDLFGWDRKRACLVNLAALTVLSMPCVLGYNLWYFEATLPNGAVGQVLDIEDFLVSNLLLPLGSLMYLLFCVTKWGWGFDKYLEEANAGKGIKVPRALKPYFQFVLPVLILVILIQGLLK